MLKYGVPADICDNDGRTPLLSGLALIGNAMGAIECGNINNILFSSVSDDLVHDFNKADQMKRYDSHGVKVKLMRSSQQMAEAMGCNRLAIAILQQNGKELQRLLHVEPSLADEENAFNDSPAHLAIPWPEGLEYLLGSCGLPPVIPGQLNTLQHAVSYSSGVCTNNAELKFCSNCSCFRPTEIVLQHSPRMDRHYDFMTLLIFASHRTRLLLLKHLKASRERLRSYALDHFQTDDSRRLGLFSTRILDAKTKDVIEILQQMSIRISPGLFSGILDPTCAATSGVSSWESVYTYIDCAAIADMAFGLGFGDVDVPGSDGNTLISKARSLGYILWLLDHGADLSTPSEHIIGSKLNQVAAHGVAGWFGGHLLSRCSSRSMSKEDWPKSTDGSSEKRLMSYLLNVHANDACDCACSIRGCTVFLSILKGYFCDGRLGNYSETGIPREEEIFCSYEL
ncbi:hypothetical protein ONS95_008345 [Cadophora gregata]|uniref:uncharacterized protein n=1 Tax=Cadophora gregata TaxID=51156 RepID=UPI0026DC664F|nr:uncharacterized protein ONS95_008345 [Cadophora gregata]KAK0100390.1 hypothetical protein ONS96_007671 [Cadophora gregata f. sp. sojae]KAK0126764.1 hypothetical protein ONS95_008345 [Cadophora gregata]